MTQHGGCRRPLLFLPGETGLPQTLQEGAVSRPVPGLPETVHVGGADPSAGTPEAPQCALSQQNQGQQPRLEVSAVANKCDQTAYESHSN